MRIVIIVCCFLGTGLSLLYFIPTLFSNLILEYNINSLLQFDWNHENVFLTNCKNYNLSIEEIALSDKLFIEKGH